MSADLWSSTGVVLETQHDDWLYQKKGQTFGPIPFDSLIAKLKSGEVPPDAPIARVGTEFASAQEVAALLPYWPEIEHAYIARARQAYRRQLRFAVSLLLGTVAVLGIGVASGRLQPAEAPTQPKEARLRSAKSRATLPESSIHDLRLVALVEFGQMRSKQSPSPATPGHKKGSAPGHEQGHSSKKAGARGPDKDAASASPSSDPQPGAKDALVAGCSLSQEEILGTLRSRISAITQCVRIAQKQPGSVRLGSALEVAFIIRSNGLVEDFAIEDPDFKTGPLANCLRKIFEAAHFRSTHGGGCPVTLPLKIPAPEAD